MACQTFPPAPFQVCGAILDKYLQTGGPNGFLLYPRSEELTNPDGIGKRSEFLGGNIYWSPSTGAHPVAHEFLTKWGEYGYEGGFMGYPTTDEIVLSDGIGRRQEFQGAWIYWSPLSGAHNIQGGIRDKWNETGAERGPLGYPTSDEVVTPDGVGRFTRFQRGMIYWSPNTGAHVVTGRILDVWSAAGYETSQYGYPTSDAVAAPEPGSVNQQFQHGSIYTHNDYLRALLVPAQGFASYDTGLHPGYCPDPLNSPPSCPVDLSHYDTMSDPLGHETQRNLAEKVVVRQYFNSNDEVNALALWDHFYANDGEGYLLAANVIDTWTAETESGYDGIAAPPTHVVANTSDAIGRAIAEADRTGQPAKVVISTPWLTTAGNSQDHVHSLGRYSICSTSAAIAHPGPPGGHQVELRQQTHMYDV